MNSAGCGKGKSKSKQNKKCSVSAEQQSKNKITEQTSLKNPDPPYKALSQGVGSNRKIKEN